VSNLLFGSVILFGLTWLQLTKNEVIKIIIVLFTMFVLNAPQRDCVWLVAWLSN
jgi:Na+/proline symporter